MSPRPKPTEWITCPRCGDHKHRRGFDGGVCRLCRNGGRKRLIVTLPKLAAASPMTAALMLERVRPTAGEMRAVEECVELMRMPPDRSHRNAARDGPEAAIDAVTADRGRRIRLGSLALQMVRERT